MAWTGRDKYPCYGCLRRTLGCQDRCPDMRAAKEKNQARKAIERTMRTLEMDLYMRNRSGRERER